jgi:hypothetical protein
VHRPPQRQRDDSVPGLEVRDGFVVERVHGTRRRQDASRQSPESCPKSVPSLTEPLSYSQPLPAGVARGLTSQAFNPS